MANKTIDMNKIRQVLRMHTQGKSKLLISQQAGVARNTVSKYIQQFHRLRMTSAEMSLLNDHDLNKLFSIEVPLIPTQREKDLQLFFTKSRKRNKANRSNPTDDVGTLQETISFRLRNDSVLLSL